jgi:hypothetical protein
MTVMKVVSVWDASFCVSFLPFVVSGSFGSEDPASPRIYLSYYFVDIARAGEICNGGWNAPEAHELRVRSVGIVNVGVSRVPVLITVV